MDLGIEDVARLLNVTEATVQKWVDSGSIPAYAINGIHRFSPNEVESWMLERQQQLRLESSKDLETQGFSGKQGLNQFGLYRALHRGGVCRNVPGHSKDEVIRSTMRALAPRFDLDADMLSELLLDREKLNPTSIGSGVAIPHSREFHLEAHYDIVTVVFPHEPIQYGALDGKPVHTLFFLFAGADARHLHLLAKIAHFCADPKMVEFLQTRPDKEALLKAVKEWEGSLGLGPLDLTDLPDSL